METNKVEIMVSAKVMSAKQAKELLEDLEVLKEKYSICFAISKLPKPFGARH